MKSNEAPVFKQHVRFENPGVGRPSVPFEDEDAEFFPLNPFFGKNECPTRESNIPGTTEVS